MTPEAAEPFHMGLDAGITGQEPQRLENVMTTDLLISPKQITGIVEHGPRVTALTQQLRDDIGHARVALGGGSAL